MRNMEITVVDKLLDEYVLISLTLILSILMLYNLRDRRISKYMKKFNGPLDWPILGSGLTIARCPIHETLQLTKRWCDENGGLFRIWIGNQPYIVLGRFKEIEVILSSNEHIEKSRDYTHFLNYWLGQGLLTAGPGKWHERRKLLTPAFHFKILEGFIDIFNEQATILVNILKEKQKENGSRSFDIFPYITRCALDIICETAMGKKLGAQSRSDVDYVKAIYAYTDMLLVKFLSPLLRVNFVWKILGYAKLELEYLKTLHGFTNQVIAEKRKERATKSKSQETFNKEDSDLRKKRAFLDLLLDLSDDGKGLTDKDIREETDTFMFEGHDTTSANIVWTLFNFALYPEHQKLAQEEVDDILQSTNHGYITSADAAKMKYLEMCIKESLRLYPSVPVFFRNPRADIDIGNGRVIPKGCNLAIMGYSSHRDPLVFPNPEQFIPERFSTESCIGRNPYAYIPFSAGPRNCIGQKFAVLEEKIIIAKLLATFNFEFVGEKEDVKLFPAIILRPKDGMPLKVTPRN